jgi:hypothetical protein
MSNPLAYCEIKLSTIPNFHEVIKQDSITDNDNNNDSNILKLTKTEYMNKRYKVIRYDKNILNDDLISTYGLCRSIIVNENDKVVCFSPPKSIPTDEFIKKHPNKTDAIIAQEFVEGTMINVFWDENIGLTGGWEISTRNTVGATSGFYKSTNSKTFRTMFLEAAQENNLHLNKLNPAYCFSFVLQHPENRIVVPFNKARIYLVAMYHIDDTDINNVKVNSYNINEMRELNWMGADIQFPQTYYLNSYTELINKYASMNTSYDVLGFVLYNALTGERSKIRNPVYEQVRALRGNQPKLQYQYLTLRKQNKVKDFLKYYPENKRNFAEYREQLHLFTNTLFMNYISCYIKKEQTLKQYPDQYRTHMFELHKLYITSLRVNKLVVTNRTVIDYVNNLQTTLLMYCLNFHMRKRSVDFIMANK